MALRCEHGMLSGLCVTPNCVHWDHGRTPRIEETGVQVATRRPRAAVRQLSSAAIIEALDSAETLALAARQLGCTVPVFYERAKTSPAIAAALQRRRARGHVVGRKRRPTSPINESTAQIIERVRVARTDIPTGTSGTDLSTRDSDLANLERLQSERPLVPPGRRAP